MRKETEVETRGEKEKEEKKKKKKIKTKYSEAGIVTTQRSDERWRFKGTREAGPQRGEQRPSQRRGGEGKGKERVKRGTSGWLGTVSGEWMDEWVNVNSVVCPRRRRNGQPLMTLP